MHSEHVVHLVGHNGRRSDDSNVLSHQIYQKFFFFAFGVGIGSRQCGRSQPLYTKPSPGFRTSERFSPGTRTVALVLSV